MFRSYTVSFPITATVTVEVAAEDWVAATELASRVLTGLEPQVVHPYANLPVLLDFDHDTDEAVTMSEEERTR